MFSGLQTRQYFAARMNACAVFGRTLKLGIAPRRYRKSARVDAVHIVGTPREIRGVRADIACARLIGVARAASCLLSSDRRPLGSVDRRGTTFDAGVGARRSRAILLNAARASLHAPLYFVPVGSAAIFRRKLFDLVGDLVPMRRVGWNLCALGRASGQHRQSGDRRQSFHGPVPRPTPSMHGQR